MLKTIPWRTWNLTVTGKLNGLWVALAACLVPASLIIYSMQSSQPESAALQLLLNPGPRHLCYAFTDLARNVSAASNRSTSECDLIPRYAGCPTWQYSSFNAGTDHEERMRGGNGSLISVTVVNNARGVCRVSEASLDYLYPGCGIETLTNVSQYNLLDFAEWIFEYDITMKPISVNRGSQFGRPRTTSWNETKSQRDHCNASGQSILTEFVYQWPDPNCIEPGNCSMWNNTISILHYSTYPKNHTRNTLGPAMSDSGYDLHLNQETHLTPGTRFHVALDFRKLFQRHKELLCHGTKDPLWIHVHTIRVVSSNFNADSTIDIQNLQANLRGNKTEQGSYWRPEHKTFDSIPAYCPGAPANNIAEQREHRKGIPFVS